MCTGFPDRFSAEIVPNGLHLVDWVYSIRTILAPNVITVAGWVVSSPTRPCHCPRPV